MEAIKLTEAFLMKWAGYFATCIISDFRTPSCTPFWTWIAYILFVIGAISVTYLIANFVSYKLKYRAALRAQEERERVADSDTMQKHIWEGDKAYQTDRPTENVELQIKAALAKRRPKTDSEPVI